ncbi:Thymocyte nuclear protein 1 [Cyphellophora attinorum]|uniref:Thymocyte nuclear protein 1 n=1 Tax=Cyphellophora attinorum TaxID=1664694 RepID=A0A0N1I1X7_9EURO|nr:Thymocyte nuclear protein 1 [Phialophora attinorum]KPI46032.1 Thymocyte nuclear protein 1 [Phialophora attinorum]
MAGRKRKAATAAASAITAASTPRSKKVRIGEESVIGENGNTRDSTPVSTSSGRAMRATSNPNPKYDFTKRRGGSNAASASQRGGRGGAAPRGRGRPPKQPVATGRGRGRPKTQIETPEESEPEVEDDAEDETLVEPVVSTPVRKGILKNKNTYVEVDVSQTQVKEDQTDPAPKRRRRPPKSDSTTAMPIVTSDLEGTETNGTTKARGRPKKSAKESTGKSKFYDEIDGLTDDEASHEAAPADLNPEVQYWLMKAEPESRMEKGIDVKGWDGVRNPVARNNMRAMRVNDLAFFYHSNCKTPGIVGMMRIVEEHQVDESAFDPKHPYYDEKSDRSKPKWELVKVEFVKKFENMLTLRELKSYANPGGMLANMQVLKQSRLSVSSVSPQEWQFILECVGEETSLGQPGVGNEGDIDGEDDAPVESPDADEMDQPDDEGAESSPSRPEGSTVVSLGDVRSSQSSGSGGPVMEGDWENSGDENELTGPD